MGKLVLNVGTTNNDKTGDTLRAGGLKIKANFEEIYNALANDGVTISGGNLLKTGDYSDLRNKPDFSTVAVSGNFFDLEARPDIGIFVGAPPNTQGSEGHVAGNLAFDGNNLYVCREDYVEQDEFTGFEYLHNIDLIDFGLTARFSNNDGTIALTADITKPPPMVDWTVSDGTTTRTITLVSEEVDGTTPYYLCNLDGSFTSNAGTVYKVGFTTPAGQHVFHATWKPEYQDLLDAHDLGQGSKIYVTYDGYGRTVTQIIHDSLENEISIAYIAGSEIADFDGLIIRLDQPNIWKSIPWAPVYGDPFPGGGTGSTGDVTFASNVVEGGGYVLGLSPGPDFTTGDYTAAPGPVLGPQYFRVRGGDNYEHLHFDTSDNSLFDLYVGDDSKYFKLSKDGHAAIGVGGPSWTFGTDGTIQFPSIETNLHNGGNQFAQTLKFGVPGQQVVITGPTPEENYNAERIIIQGQLASGTGEGGDVYLWGGDAEHNGGDIKIYAGDATSGISEGNQGGYINIESGYGHDNGGQLSLKAGNSATYGGNVRIQAGTGPTIHGQIELNTNDKYWYFKSTGDFELPVGGDIKNSSGVSVLSPIGQHLYLMDEVNIASTFTEVNFSLLLATPAVGYMGSDTHTISLPNGAPGQRFVVVNNSSLCTVEIGPHAIAPLGRAEFVYTDGLYGDGWIPLYGTV